MAMRAVWCGLILALAVCSGTVGAAEAEMEKGSVVVVPLKGPVSEAQFFFLRRVLKKAEQAGASAFVIDMDTPGGSLPATEQIVQLLLKATMPTYTFVNTNAGSAGALIALGTKHVYMAPVSAIGAAAPVMGSGEELQETMNAKVVSYYSGYFRSVAQQNNYHPELVDGFMNLDKEVKIGDTVLNPKGAILTLSAQEATKVIDGRPLLASGIASSIDQLCEKAGLRAKAVVRIEPSGFEVLAQWITMLAPLFLVGGIVGAYIEFKTPGFGIAGSLAALCFLLFFTGHYIAGLTGFEMVALFLLGVLLVILELVFFPGALVLAAVGTVLMLGALLFAMVDVYPAEPFQISFDVLIEPMVNLGIAVVAAGVFMALLARFLPELPFFGKVVLARAMPAGPSLTTAELSVFDPRVTVGETGLARTALRPAGKAEFGAALVDVVADGEFLEAGSRVRVVRVEGPVTTVVAD